MQVDSRFRVETISKTPDPQQTIYAAMHQDYSEGFVYDEFELWPTERIAGQIVVKHLLAGDRGHYGPLEHVSITFNCGWFPHSVMQQARTHRISSFDCQSMRYTGQRIIDAANGITPLEDVIYLRPVGEYRDRSGKRYFYSEEHRAEDLLFATSAVRQYRHNVEELGFAEEHARGILPFDFRQHFVVSFNLRSALHFMDLRSKKDAQWEIQQLCTLMWEQLRYWVPEITAWYEEHRLGRARLSP